MDAKERANLKALLKLLRENGVTSFDNGQVKLALEPLPAQTQAADRIDDLAPDSTELTPEQILFLSVQEPGQFADDAPVPAGISASGE